MIINIIIWLIQDLAQVFAMGLMLVPEVFILVMMYRVMTPPAGRGGVGALVWTSFAGGLIWDLRWASMPGTSALTNVICVAWARWMWLRTPAGGRGPVMFAIVAAPALFTSGLVHYIAWAVPSQAAIRMFALQQVLSVIPLAILAALYAARTKGR